MALARSADHEALMARAQQYFPGASNGNAALSGEHSFVIAGGQGAYRSPLRRFVTVGSATSYTRAAADASRVGETGAAEWGDADAFEQRLRRALENRAFLALTVSPRRLGDVPRSRPI